MPVRYEQIEEARLEVENIQRAYLQRWGWIETSSTPGAYWLWRRDFSDIDAQRKEWDMEHPNATPSVPYGVVTAPTDLAVNMTVRCLDES